MGQNFAICEVRTHAPVMGGDLKSPALDRSAKIARKWEAYHYILYSFYNFQMNNV